MEAMRILGVRDAVRRRKLSGEGRRESTVQASNELLIGVTIGVVVVNALSDRLAQLIARAFRSPHDMLMH